MRRSISRQPRIRPPRGFTMVELLVVMVIMLLILGLVLPAIRAINGSRSVEVAYNEVAAVLQRARLRAIGLVQETGVMFYMDPQTQQTAMVMVYTTPSLTGDPPPTNEGGTTPVDHFVDMVPNTSIESLPPGVGFQTVNSAYLQPWAINGWPGSGVLYNGYVPAPNGSSAPFFGGLILFDGQGRVLKVPWGCRTQPESNSGGVSTTSGNSPIGNLIYNNGNQSVSAPASTYIPGPSAASVGGPGNTTAPITSFAFTLYDNDTFATQGFNISTPSSNQQSWLVAHGYEVILSSYSGALLKTE